MNFYKRHLGDFARDTAHLSPGQVGCYDLLLDWYYANERPLPLDLDDVRRIARAASAEERRNVDKVLRDFFVEEPDGYHQKRADAEIAEWHRQCAHNRDVGRRGGRPRKTQPVPETKPGKNPTGYFRVPKTPDLETRTEPGTNPLQNPDTREEQDQEQNPTPRSVAAAGGEDPACGGSSAGDEGASVLALEPPEPDGAVLYLPAVTGERVPIPADRIERYAAAYPLVDVRRALDRIALWLDDNPKRRPTKGGVLRFVTAWLARDQQRAAEAGVRGFQSARVIEGGLTPTLRSTDHAIRRESLCERVERLNREADLRDRRGAA